MNSYMYTLCNYVCKRIHDIGIIPRGDPFLNTFLLMLTLTCEEKRKSQLQNGRLNESSHT